MVIFLGHGAKMALFHPHDSCWGPGPGAISERGDSGWISEVQISDGSDQPERALAPQISVAIFHHVPLYMIENPPWMIQEIEESSILLDHQEERTPGFIRLHLASLANISAVQSLQKLGKPWDHWERSFQAWSGLNHAWSENGVLPPISVDQRFPCVHYGSPDQGKICRPRILIWIEQTQCVPSDFHPIHWLVGGLDQFLFFQTSGRIIPDFNIFQKGVSPPSSLFLRIWTSWPTTYGALRTTVPTSASPDHRISCHPAATADRLRVYGRDIPRGFPIVMGTPLS